MNDIAIRAEGLVKRFGQTIALDGVSLEGRRGRVLGLLGPNGSGKTTAVRILTTLLRPDAGRATIAGHDVLRDAHRARQVIGLTGQYVSADDELTAELNLVMVGRLLHLGRAEARSRARELLERFSLADVANKPVSTFSGGMRRRLDLAASLVGRPRVLFLDEPTTGIDPAHRLELWDLVRELVRDGSTVLLTTQYLDEADQLAHDIVVLDHGRVIATGTPDELKAQTGGQVLEVRAAEPFRAAAVVRELAGQATVDPDRSLVSAPASDPRLAAAAVRRLDDAGIAIMEIALRRPSLDEVFIALTRGDGQPSNAKQEVAA
jgi:oleandomycin transport system ATP-binding protein